MTTAVTYPDNFSKFAMFSVGKVKVSGRLGTAILVFEITSLTAAPHQWIVWDGDSLTGSVSVDVLHLSGRSLQVNIIDN